MKAADMESIDNDPPFTTPGFRPPPQMPRPGELLFEFVRASDGAPIRGEPMFHGEELRVESKIPVRAPPTKRCHDDI